MVSSLKTLLLNNTIVSVDDGLGTEVYAVPKNGELVQFRRLSSVILRKKGLFQILCDETTFNLNLDERTKEMVKELEVISHLTGKYPLRGYFSESEGRGYSLLLSTHVPRNTTSYVLGDVSTRNVGGKTLEVKIPMYFYNISGCGGC